MTSLEDVVSFKRGDVLVADGTHPDWGAGDVQGFCDHHPSRGRTCHAAITTRDYGIPAVVGGGDATEKLRSEDSVMGFVKFKKLGEAYEWAMAM